jgi:molybdopterin/thiamine biosynthesis adenylyltransferase
MEIKVIGLGGVGSAVSNFISKYLYYLNDLTEDINMTLIDGDSYEEKNHTRQLFQGIGNKAKIKEMELYRTYSNKINYSSIPLFVNPLNVNSIINDNDIVFLSVDNHMTRKVVADRCKQLDNIVLISGGNELVDGNVQIHVRKDGKDITPSIDKFHPEIQTPGDKSPEDMSCDELAVSVPQLFFMNMMVAVYMCAAFYNVVIKNTIHSEVYMDLQRMNSDSKIRKVK